MFHHRGAILRESIETKEYKFNTPIQVLMMMIAVRAIST
jgi:hypothetical protein